MNLGVPEIIIIAIIIFALFGYKKLPDATRAVGRSLRIFKGEMKGLKDDDIETKAEAQTVRSPLPPAQPPYSPPQPAQPPYVAPQSQYAQPQAAQRAADPVPPTGEQPTSSGTTNVVNPHNPHNPPLS